MDEDIDYGACDGPGSVKILTRIYTQRGGAVGLPESGGQDIQLFQVGDAVAPELREQPGGVRRQRPSVLLSFFAFAHSRSLFTVFTLCGRFRDFRSQSEP